MRDEIPVPRDLVKHSANLLRLLSDLTHISTRSAEISSARNMAGELLALSETKRRPQGSIQISRKAVTKIPPRSWQGAKRLSDLDQAYEKIREQFELHDGDHRGQASFFLTLTKVVS